MGYADIADQYKSEGKFDLKRRDLLDKFQGDTSGIKDKLNALLEQLVDLKIEDNPELLVENRGKLVAVIQASLTKQQLGKKLAGFKSTNDPSSNKSLEHSSLQQQKVIDEISKLLNQYVSETVSHNKELEHELEDELSEILTKAKK